ncbi:hypothetical protein [Parasitella parasitica]|uniref:Uncharacterized protein n=1 Tax=Parasitella parasitica TaxID=35722 RepID=A0A0B7NLV5_9FUNG|nr:hypothetical protein [Parasitella parasitica]
MQTPDFSNCYNQDQRRWKGGLLGKNLNRVKVESRQCVYDYPESRARPQILQNETLPEAFFDLAVEEEVSRRFNYCEANGATRVIRSIELVA